MPNRDGIDNILIYWDDDDGIYNAGQTLSGRIEVYMYLLNKNQKEDLSFLFFGSWFTGYAKTCRYVE